MKTKQRDIVYQHWSGVIRRETQDLASLELISTRALGDRDVRGDPTLESMIRADLQNRRAELEQEMQRERSLAASAESQSDEASVPSEPIPTAPPGQVREAFDLLAQTLLASLERGDDKETHAAFAKIRTLQEQNPGVVSPTTVADYERRVGELRAHRQQLEDQIATLRQRVVSASECGDEQDLARSLRRLTAIHAAHPRLLDEAGLNEIRAAALHAADERRRNQRTTRKLLERERAIAAEIKKLAAAVRDFHRVACTVPDTSEEFRKAEATYLRTIQKVRTYDTEWFSGVVLELADLLAEWTVPPLEAESQIDRFLDSITAGLKSIRAEIREIESDQDSDEGDECKSAPP
jgi:hypothetical protein